MTRDDITKHEEKFVRDPMSGCWIWTASVDKHGYGMLWNGKQMDRAHRLFYSFAFGTNVSGVKVLHDCDNPYCVNPHHLHVGTQAQNMKEKSIRGRAGKKLTQDVAEKIKDVLKTGVSQRRVANIFGVSQRLIFGINKGLIWSANK